MDSNTTPTRESAPLSMSECLPLQQHEFWNTSLSIFMLLDSVRYQSDSSTPHAKKVEGHALYLLPEFVVVFHKLNDTIRSITREIQRLSSLEISTEASHSTVWSLTVEIKDTFEDAIKSLKAAGPDQLDIIGQKLAEYKSMITHEINMLTSKIREHQNRLPSEAGKRRRPVASLFQRLGLKRSLHNDSGVVDDIKRQVDEYTEERKKILGFSEQVDKSSKCVPNCKFEWKTLCFDVTESAGLISESLPTDIMTPQLKENIFKILKKYLDDMYQISKKMKDILEELDDKFGPSTCMNGKVKDFRRHIDGISISFDQLFEFQNVILEEHRRTFLEDVRALANSSQEYLLRIQDVLAQWIQFTRTGPSIPVPFITDVYNLGKDTPTFQSAYEHHCNQIYALLEKSLSNDSKEKRTGNGRAKRGDTALPISTTTTCTDVLDDLKNVLHATSQFSITFSMDVLLFTHLQGSEVQQGCSIKTSVVDDTEAHEAFRVIDHEIRELKRIAKPDEQA